MNGEELIALANKILDKEASEEEVRQYNAWYNARQQAEDFDIADAELKRAAIYVRVEQAIELKNAVGNVKVRRLWPRIAAASVAWKVAAAVAVITLGVWLYYASSINSRHPDSTLSSRVSRDLNDVAPGKNTATLTLANGETINLSDTKTGVVVGSDLKYNDGSAVANLSPFGRDGVTRESNSNNPLSPQGGSLPEGERSMMLTASTPRGGTYQVTLPDGTKVWLNADSKLVFPSQFSTDAQRIVKLSGEAYFEVAKLTRPSSSGRDGLRLERVPFIVQTPNERVDVLGTHFNISDYKDEPIVKTTLLEGSIRLGGKLILKPGEQSQTTRNRWVSVVPANLEEVMAWKEGNFVFNDEDLESILRKVARWYDVDIVYEHKPGGVSLLGVVSRSKNVSAVLNALEQTGKVHFRIEGRRIVVTK